MSRVLTALGILFLGMAARAQAQDLPTALAAELQQAPPAAPAAAEEKWRIDLALYFWVASVQGDLTSGTLSASVDAEFSETLDRLDGAIALHEEIWHKNRFGILIDVNWVRVRDDPNVNGVASDVTVETGINEVAGAMRFLNGEVFLDVLAGARWVLFRSSIETASNGPSDTRETSLIDPMFGLRLGGDPTDWLRLSARVDVGGFGIGTELSGQFTLMAQFRLGDHVEFILGYRSLGMDIKSQGIDAQLRMHGPVFAVAFGF